MKEDRKKKVYLIGLDGFNLRLFHQLEREGVMPRLSRIIRGGVHGPLASTLPPYSGPAWVSMFTGVNPGRHGVFGFTRRKSGSYENFVLNGSHASAVRIWDLLSDRGVRAGVFNVPFTFPPGRLDGFMVSGMLTPSLESDFTYPASVKDEILQTAPSYDIDISLNLERDWRNKDVIKRLEREIEGKERVLLNLLERYDPAFFMAVFVAPDRIQHLWWKWIMEDTGRHKKSAVSSFRDSIYKLFSKLDQTIGGIHDRLSEGDVFLLSSDHGFTSFDKTFYLNNWLLEEGFLEFKGGGGAMTGFFRLFNRPGLKRYFPRFLLNYAGSGAGRNLIDWSKTRAYASPNMEEGIYINLQGREPLGQVTPGTEYEKLRDEIKERIRNFSPSPGSPGTFKEILRKEDLYHGDYLDYAPDLTLVFEDGWNMSSSFSGRQLWRGWSDLPWGVHHSQGIWGAAGGGIKAEIEPMEADIKDIFPTILSLFRIPVPSEVEGKTIERVVRLVAPSRDGAAVGLRSAASRPFSSAEEAEIKDRLEGLGYI